MNPSDEPSKSQKSLLDSAKNLAAHFLNIFQIRLDLLVTEIEEEYLRVVQLVILLSIVIFFVGMFLVTGSCLIVLYFWDDYRLVSLGCLLAVYATISLAAFVRFQSLVSAKPKLFADSLSELRKDCDILHSLSNDKKS